MLNLFLNKFLQSAIFKHMFIRGLYKLSYKAKKMYTFNKMKTDITLTVQPSANKNSPKNKWRLGLKTSDSNEYFVHLEEVKIILTEGISLITKAVCGTSKKKSFDFNGEELSKWIENKDFHDYTNRKPTKLLFELHNDSKIKILEFISKKKV